MNRGHITVTGGYGRDYKTADAAIADWDANKDFTIHTPGCGGRYINKGQAEQVKADGWESVMIRFNKKEDCIEVAL